MKTLDLIQGSQEWLNARMQYMTASEAPAMLGLSKYKTRSELLCEKATGIAQEVDAATQRRFDAGHAAEAATRVWAEKLIGEDLYPTTGVTEIDGLRLLASFDGVNLDESICWENKLWNEDFAEQVRNGIAPDTHWPQMEQQMLVSGAQKVLFTVSDGDTQIMHTWYESVPERRARLIAGWKQFKQDLRNYQHTEIAEKPAAQVSIALPALFMQARGEITESNMAEYGLALAAKLAEVRSIVLVDDQDFANADSAAKLFRDQIKKLALTKDQMLSQTMSVGDAVRTIDAWSEDLRVTALQLEKDVARKDKEKKIAMIDVAQLKYFDHIDVLNKRIGGRWMPTTRPDFSLAIKGKSKYRSMQDAIDTMLRDGMYESGLMADRIDANRKSLTGEAHDWMFLFPDFPAVCQKPVEDFAAMLSMRITNHKAAEDKRLEAEREKIRAEERAKAEAEAQAKAKAEKAALDAEEMKKRAEFEHLQREEAKAFQRQAAEQAQGRAAMAEAEQLIASAKSATATPPIEQSAETAESENLLKLGQIGERLGFSVTAEFIASLGILPKAQDRSAKLYSQADFIRVCDALIARVTAARNAQYQPQ